MTDDQRDKLNRFLAVEVLKVHTCQYGYIEDVPDFSKWADCEPLLDKIERDGWKWMLAGEMLVGGERYECAISKGTGGTIISQASSSRTEALCLAVGRAYGWKLEG